MGTAARSVSARGVGWVSMIATRQDGRWQRAVPVVAWQQCRACLHNDLHFDPAGAGCGTHQGSRASCIRRRRAPPTAHAPSRPPPAPQPRRTRLPAPARSVGFAPWPLDNVLKLRLTRGTQEFRSKTHTSGGRCPSASSISEDQQAQQPPKSVIPTQKRVTEQPFKALIASCFLFFLLIKPGFKDN